MDEPQAEASPHRPSVIKLGKGKKAVPIFEIRRASEYSYSIFHMPTLTLVSNLYIYLSLARDVTNEVLAYAPELWCNTDRISLARVLPKHIIDYIQYYRGRKEKHALTLGEFSCSEEYEDYLRGEYNRSVLASQAREYEEELQQSDTSISYMAVQHGGTMSASELERVIRGKPTKV